MFTKDNRFRVLRLFFRSPTKEFHIREIAGLAGMSPAGILKILNALENEKLLVKKKGRVTTNYKANLESEEFSELKKIYNIYSIYSSGLLRKLIEFYNTPEAIVLFGSYAKGEDLEKGDLDIAVVTEREEYPSLKNFERELNRTIALHLVKNIEKSEPEFINSLANGVVLFGYLKVV